MNQLNYFISERMKCLRTDGPGALTALELCDLYIADVETLLQSISSHESIIGGLKEALAQSEIRGRRLSGPLPNQ